MGLRASLAALLTACVISTAYAEIIPADRRIDWDPGIPGGIPHDDTQPGAQSLRTGPPLAQGHQPGLLHHIIDLVLVEQQAPGKPSHPRRVGEEFLRIDAVGLIRHGF